MSFTDTEFEYEDEILRLARDPNLSREKGKTSKIISIIHNFPLSERTVSRLCSLSLSILQTLEKIELNLKNWAFLSLDINSAQHFDSTNPDEIKSFNNNVSMKVIESCQELTMKLNKISADMDFITKASRNLTPMEFLSDSGTLLTSLSLRNIRLKDTLREKVTIAYSKAKLITIGTNLEVMLEGGTIDQKSTVQSYKQFVVSLLSQLNSAIDSEDEEEKNECLAVISDMEQMFEVFKLEYAQRLDEPVILQESDVYETSSQSLYSQSSKQEGFSDLDDLSESSSILHSMSASYVQPTVHSITRPHTSPDSTSVIEQHARRSSFSSVASTSILQKSTLSEELPYLMSAFDSAKTLEEDVFHFKDKEVVKKPKSEATSSATLIIPPKQLPNVRHHLPQSTLYTSSQMLPLPPMSASSYLYSNNSLLSKLGIKPQVISTTLPKQEFIHKQQFILPQKSKSREDYDNKDTDNHVVPLTRANLDNHVVPLTRANLDNHNFSAISSGVLLDTMDSVE